MRETLSTAESRDSFAFVASLTRCPGCDTFVKLESVEEGACPFCPAASLASRRNPIPGMVLAAAIAAMPGCSDDDAKPKPDASAFPDGAVYGVAFDAGPVDDAMSAVDASLNIYGIAPDSDD